MRCSPCVLSQLRGQSLPDKHNLRVRCIHSNNAAQHFKSAKSIQWMTRTVENTFTAAVWSFGALGHGKGPWDGVGGMLKTLRPNAALRAEGLLGSSIHTSSAYDSYKFLSSRFRGSGVEERVRCCCCEVQDIRPSLHLGHLRVHERAARSQLEPRQN